MELYIVRHGKTVWNEKGLLQGTEDIHLISEGREVAGNLGRELEDISFDYFYSSPLMRAYETACLIRGYRNIEIRKDDRLKEISFGIKEGTDYSDFRDAGQPYHCFFDDPVNYVPPAKAETFENVLHRTKDFLENEILPLVDENKEQRILIVGHGALNAGLTSNLEKRDLAHYWGAGLQRNCECIKYRLDTKSGLWSKI